MKQEANDDVGHGRGEGRGKRKTSSDMDLGFSPFHSSRSRVHSDRLGAVWASTRSNRLSQPESYQDLGDWAESDMNQLSRLRLGRYFEPRPIYGGDF